MEMKKIIYIVFNSFIVISSLFAQESYQAKDYNFKKSLDLNVTMESIQLVDSTVIKIPLGAGKRLEDIKSIDINSDGTDEMIVLTIYDNGPQVGQLLVYQWIDSQFKIKWQSEEYTGYPYGMQVNDIDNDGKKDILVSMGGLKYFKNDDSIFIYKGTLTYYTTNGVFLVDDLDSDNYSDLVLGSPYSNGRSAILFKQNPDNTTFDYIDSLAGTPGSNMVKSININNDLDIDIIKGELYSGDIQIYKNNGVFSFDIFFEYTLSTRIFSIESTDFDNDNFEDFIVAQAWANVHFFKNNGVDSFQEQFSGSNIGSAFQSQSYDIDYDGYCDLVVGAFDGKVYLYHNLGGFDFTEIECPISANSNYGLAVGDFNNDNKSDIAFGKDTVFVVLNASNIFGVTSINDNKIVKAPVIFALSQNYPNPFNPSTKINYQLPKTSFVTLNVYDVLGNEIASLVSKEKPAGSYEIKFDATQLSSGIYFYKLQAGSFVEIRKMVLLR